MGWYLKSWIPVQGENVEFSVTIENLGKSPATNFEVSVNPDAFQIATRALLITAPTPEGVGLGELGITGRG